MRDFNEDGLSFSYPDDWKIEREPGAEGWTVSLQSPGTAFAVVRLERDVTREPQEVEQAALKALKDVYPALEAEPFQDMIAGDMAVGHEIHFFSLDFTNTCWTRCFYGLAGIVFVMCQVSDDEEGTYGPALRAICASMRSEED
jgi:hypothetical protein